MKGEGDQVDNPKTANLTNPLGHTTICGMNIDLTRFKEAADKLGADKYDVLSISGYRNAKGVLIPDYDTVKIVKRSGTDGS